MKHYLWAVISQLYDPHQTKVEWHVTTDPNPTHHSSEQWVRVAEFIWS